MSGDRLVQVVEIDTDYCTLTWGTSPCNAAFGLDIVRKCYNTFGTCSFQQAYNKGVLTTKFIESSFPVKTGNYIPTLISATTGYEQEVNIAGFSSKVGALGVRANISVTFSDMPTRDVLTDKYWQQRMSGAAQTDEPGYDPLDRGSFWTKFKARNPNYAGRPIRIIEAIIGVDGTLTYQKTRHYVMDEIKGPDRSGNVTVTAKDALSLADDKKALAPLGSRGMLMNDINDSQTSITLAPVGIGPEYPVSGVVVVGSEIMTFTRAGDVMTVVRGQKGTQAASHSVNDTVQLCYNVEKDRAGAVIRDLLVNYGNIPASYIPVAEWQAEFNRWGSSLKLSATICKPTSVVQLIGEINQLGITIWWDEIEGLVRLMLNHPPDEAPVEWTDRNNIISITTEDNDDERATRIEMWTVQIDPTKDVSKENFARGYLAVGVLEETPNMFGIPRTHTIHNRWLNHGADSAVKVITGRLLNRYRRAPVTYNVTIDAKDDPKLTDVISLETYVATNDTGKIVPKLTQVFYRKDAKSGSRIDVKLQGFQFDQRYGRITENSRPTYPLSTEAQKVKGTYICGPSLVFADGRRAYQLI